MTVWNYRLIKINDEYLVQEVFYNNEYKPETYSDISIGGDTPEEVITNLKRLKRDVTMQKPLDTDKKGKLII